MNYLFIHQNFPGQYRHVVRHLAGKRGNRIYFITQPNANEMTGVTKVTYPKDERGPVNCHAYTVEFDRAVHNGAFRIQAAVVQAGKGRFVEAQ